MQQCRLLPTKLRCMGLSFLRFRGPLERKCSSINQTGGNFNSHFVDLCAIQGMEGEHDSVPRLWVTSCEVNRLSLDVGVMWLSTWPQFGAAKTSVINRILPDKDLIGWVINSPNRPEPFEIELVCGNHVVARSNATSQLAAAGAPGLCLRCDTK